MNIQVEDKKPCQKALKIALPSHDLKEAHQKVLHDFQKQSRVPGFRQGKAPLKMVESRFSSEIKSEVLKFLLPKICRDALHSEKIQAISDPVVDQIKYDLEKGLTFEAVVDILPKVDLPEYKKLELEKPAITVSEEEMDKMIEELKEHRALFKPVPDKILAHDDYAVVDYSTVDPKGKKEDHKNALIAITEKGKNELSDQLVGMQVGETRKVMLEGPKLTFQVTLNEVKEKILPQLDEDFFKEFQVADLEGLRLKVKSEIEVYKTKTGEQALRNQAVRILSDRVTFDVPSSQTRQEVENLYSELLGQVRQGLVSRKNLEDPKLDENLHKEALRRVRVSYLLHHIAEKETLKVEDQELTNEVLRISQNVGKSPEEVRASFEKENRLEVLRSRITQDKVIDFILENAIIKTVNGK
ncbi:MAG: trigger factor [Chlamydiae bacterium]|nr:trigger factor [Chlamydiota bacterium]MBI3277110.1 trigger factor [Chlamydiota bacterium]